MKLKQVDGPLPVKVQLAIFKSVLTHYKHYGGLCSVLYNVTRYAFNYEISQVNYPGDMFPLFTRENAIEHAGAKAKGAYWWPIDDYESRRIFLDWMITELKKHA